MTANTKIEWADHTFNPWIGCTKVGPGCDHCYAETLATVRLGVAWGPGAQRRRTAVSTWQQPRVWDRRAARLGIRYRVFCASLADVFDNAAPAEWRIDLFALIRETPNLDWLLVTKRIGNAAKMAEAAGGWPANVWLGATIVNQDEADRDVPKLLATAGPRFRFLSMEPLLGPVDLEHVQAPRHVPEDHDLDWKFSALSAGDYYEFQCSLGYWEGGDGPYRDHRLDWIIVGGESGHDARPMHPDWARSLRDQCAAAGVPFLFKQWGEWVEIDGPRTKGGPVSRQLRGPHVAYIMEDGEVIDRDHRLWPTKSAYRDYLMAKVGKGKAGRLLDGVTHDGLPA